MRLLLINYTMDEASPVLGWQPRLAARLASRCERLVVLTERVGPHVPASLDVRLVPRVLITPLRVVGGRSLMNLPVWRWCAQERFDAVFVHMNADWVFRLAPCWQHFDLPVLLWYAHGKVTSRLHRAHAHASRIITSTPEGFRIPSDKVRVIGQGIDTDLFVPSPVPQDSASIVAVGRVSRTKSIDLMIDTLGWLKTHAPQHPFTLRFVGPTLTRDDEAYAQEMRALVRARGLERAVTFDGPQPMASLPEIYHSAFVHLNLGQTGSLDKAILESLACGCPTMTSNPAAFDVLAGYPDLLVRERTPEAIGRQICRAFERRQAFGTEALRSLVRGRHDLDSYTERVWGVLSELVQARAA